MAALGTSRVPPSAQWTSFAGWNYNGMKERLQGLLAKIEKSVLTRHAQNIKGQKVTMSQPFSVGQYWICFEMIAEDGSSIIARVRLPRHPIPRLPLNLPAITLPQIYAYEGLGSQLAADAGAIYMLLEGFYGNTLQDVEPDLCNLSEHIMTQWTRVQVELATLAYPRIGSISSVSTTGEPVIGRLASASAEGLRCHGPFSSTAEYFTAVADAAISKLDLTDTDSNGGLSCTILGAFVFRDIVQNTTLFEDGDAKGRFPLNHMDLGTQNILVDDRFNFRAIIDWEFAQTAPWQVNHYLMPFPLQESDTEIQGILQDPNHLAHRNVSRQEFARRLYTKKFRDAEVELRKTERSLGSSFAEVLDSPASRIYACFTKLGRLPMADASLVHEMVRLAFDLDAEGTERYLHDIWDRLK
ncbi:hypothetical protein QBC43DRAFT_342722 [Cladorrhinum sp. PSN259]|nr:hypothetical protein QBC43DRAFT_342722 [Cladorrhinum sp. PSN259]